METPLQVSWGEPLLQPVRDREAEALIKREAGSLPPWSRPFLPAPWVAKATVKFRPENGLLVDLDFDLADLVSLVVSQENSCRYCYAVSRALLRVQGMSEATVRELEQKVAQADFDSRRAAAIRFTRRMTRANPAVMPDDLQMLREEGFSDGAIRELAFVIASVGFFNRINTFPATPTQFWEKAPDRWIVRLLRPVLAAGVARMNRRGKAVARSEPEGPYARLLRVYADSPIGPALREVLDDMWRSPLLPRRSKALMFAVIGRCLGCTTSLGAARAALREEGMTDADVERVLAHLTAPGLGKHELLLLEFARDSVWYDAASIQRRAREVHAQLGTPAFVEALGVVSLGNAVCQLGSALARP